jgi:tetratricopeptide (TPR) repeat protein
MPSLLALLLALVPGTVVVLPPDPPAAGAEPWIAELVADQLPRTLSDLGVPAVSRADRLRAQAALEIPLVRVTRATSIRIAEALGATRLVTGAYTVEAGKLSLSLRILDVERGTLSAPLVAAGPLESASSLVDSLAWDVALAGPTRPATSRDALLAREPAVPFEALRSYGRGLAARDTGNRAKLLRHALALSPTFHVARLALGRLQLDQREFSVAQDTLARIPDNASVARRARFLQGVAMLEVGRYREAAALYGTLATTDPSAAVLNNHALALLRGGGGTHKASDVLRKAVELSPDSMDITFNLAFALLLEGEADAAEFFFRSLSRQAPLDRHIRVLLAWSVAKAGRAADAEKEWKGVVALAPSYATLTTPDLTRRFEKIQLSERPLDLGKETRSDTEVATSLLLRAQRIFESGDQEGALQEATRAAYLDPYNPGIHSLLGRIHRARGQFEPALNEFRMSLWSRDDAGVRVEVALLLREAGRLAESRAEAEKALRLDPSREDARRLAQAQ